jgi:cation transport regulator ChaC
VERGTAEPGNPGSLLSWQFGPHREGLAYYLVVEHARQVAVLEVLWFG